MYRDAAVVVRDGVTARQSVDVSCGIEVADGIPAVSDPSQPHDALFKRTFSDPVLASGEFRAMLPAALLEATDFGTLKLCAGSYVDEALVKSESDLLFEAKVAGRDTFFYVLFEHQSQPDPLMPLRMLRYVVRILERYAAEGSGRALSLPLPVVIPLVLHHGERGWTVARRVEDLFGADFIARAGVADLVPRLSLLVDDLASRSDAELARRGDGQPRAVVTLHLFRDRRNFARFQASLGVILPALRALLADREGREDLQTFLRYAFFGADDDVSATLVDVAGTLDPQAKEDFMTLAEKWLAEREAKGKAEGKAEVLRKLATLKFGPLPASVTERFGEATLADLERWTERVLTATTLEEMIDG